MNQTIFALASAQGRAGVSIIRISGPRALEALRLFTDKPVPARQAVYTALRHDGEVIDQAVVLWFAAPNSFTGEDCVELHVHGSRAILDRIYGLLADAGLRLAGPGEFSRRAVENGKLDLTQAEGIADLVDAESEAQRRQALTQMGGGLRAQYEAWRSQLVEILARIEVYIDFPDEDLPVELTVQILDRIRDVEASLRAALADGRRGRQIREGFRIVILGEPNAGKSSLFNALLQAEAAIVTPVAGTTRDVIEAQFRVGPYSVLLYDTAGLRETTEVVEAEGIRRARAKGEVADLRVWVVDASDKQAVVPGEIRPGDVVAFNKYDQCTDNLHESFASSDDSRETLAFKVSTVTGLGMAELIANVEKIVTAQLSMQTFPAATRQRHLDRLDDARDQLGLALTSGLGVPELTAEHIRAAINAFEALFGRYDVEGVLDVVFSTFCIGK